MVPDTNTGCNSKENMKDLEGLVEGMSDGTIGLDGEGDKSAGSLAES
jgi:hypothetical protein